MCDFNAVTSLIVQNQVIFRMDLNEMLCSLTMTFFFDKKQLTGTSNGRIMLIKMEIGMKTVVQL